MTALIVIAFVVLALWIASVALKSKDWRPHAGGSCWKQAVTFRPPVLAFWV